MTSQTITQIISETEVDKNNEQQKYKWDIIWRNVILYILMHIGGLIGLYFVFAEAKIITTIWGWFLLYVGLQGITSGVHRLWAHRAYKARLPLRILLAFCNTIALQNHIYDWARDHRVHHKYVDTDADPHNSKRGLFFSHMGWLFVKKLPEVNEKVNSIDDSDLLADPVVMIQKKYYHLVWAPIIGFFLPAWIPWYYWGENFIVAFFLCTMLRYALCTNITFLVNSVAHVYGSRPYDKNLRPTDNAPVSVVTGGEGWHNYHHVFPWDYKAGELGNYRSNISCAFIELMAKIGWAYELKSVSQDMLQKRVLRTGDGSRKCDKIDKLLFGGDEHDHRDQNSWGWGDKDLTKEDLKFVEVTNRKTD